MKTRHAYSFAKINIGLRILGKRPDAYHEIETIFQQISLKDVITIIERENGIDISCDNEACPTDHRNLAHKAAKVMQRPGRHGCHIRIKKNIPIGGGLGGGSSNAATTLLLLNKLWELHFDRKKLLTLAAEIGSDVPFFILGGTAHGQGRGEILSPIKLRTDYYGLLVCPDLHISTKWAYENVKIILTKTIKNSKFYSLTKKLNDFSSWQTSLPNDFEVIVFKKYPELVEIMDFLTHSGAFYAHMSGSGSSIYGLYASEKLAKRAYEDLKKNQRCYLFRPTP